MSKKDTPEELYDGITHEEWVKELEISKHHNRQHLYALWAYFGSPSTMLDVGCGLGDLVITARNIGVEAYGVDQLVDDSYNKDWFVHQDLREPFSLPSSIKDAPSVVNHVYCWEVAEHIPEEDIDIFLDTVSGHVKRDEGSFLFFTSAHPGQGGTEHNTTRPAEFWRDQFHIRGLNYLHVFSTKLALLWNAIDTPLYWLAANVQVFQK